VVVTIRDGVAEKIAPSQAREGTVHVQRTPATSESVIRRERLPVDPQTADIRHVRRLVCGGRGVGGAHGFETLRRVAEKLDAGLAASRVAVDLGWVEHARQIGQTGKTVRPDVYIGCGVSGASHHLEGMSESQHIIAINSDPEAPLVKRASLALVADLHQVLDHLERALDAR
jgi:electron transfer flavoprotein alpha subunit